MSAKLSPFTNLWFAFIPFLLVFIKAQDPIEIDLSSNLGTTAYYTVEEKTINLSNDNGNYKLYRTSSIYNIKVSSSCTINLNSLTLSSPESAPILIEQNKIVTLILIGESTLVDTAYNQNEGVIYLKKEAKLTISGEGTLNIQPNKHMAINGTESTSLIVNSGTINIISTATGVGGIYLRKEIIFNEEFIISKLILKLQMMKSLLMLWIQRVQ